MGTTTSFSFTNVADSTAQVTLKQIKPVSVYAKTEDEATNCTLKNKTCKLDQGEVLSYQCTPIDKVNSKLTSLNPAKVTSGVQYIVRLDELLRTMADDGSIVCDEPITAMLQIRHPNSGNITPAHITTVVTRLLSACYNESDGDWRWKELMLSALVPVND